VRCVGWKPCDYFGGNFTDVALRYGQQTPLNNSLIVTAVTSRRRLSLSLMLSLLLICHI